MSNRKWSSENWFASPFLVAAYKVLWNEGARALFDNIEDSWIPLESFFEWAYKDLTLMPNKYTMEIPEIRRRLASTTFELENLKNEWWVVIDGRSSRFLFDKQLPVVCYVKWNWKLLDKDTLKYSISDKVSVDGTIVFSEKDSKSYIRDFPNNNGILVLDGDFRSANNWLKIFHSKITKWELAIIGFPSESANKTLVRGEKMIQILSKSSSTHVVNPIMRSVFVSGSMSIWELPMLVIKWLDRLVAKKNTILVGDASGVDFQIQKYLAKLEYHKVTVYSAYARPRNIASRYFDAICLSLPLPITKEEQTKKDVMMTEQSDISFVIWDGTSSGSYQNILRCLSSGKEIQIYLASEARYLEKSQLNEQYISWVYQHNHKYSLTEYIKINKGSMKTGAKTAGEMKRILEERWIINNDLPSPKYVDLISITTNRWKRLLKFQKALLDESFMPICNEVSELKSGVQSSFF